MPPNCRWIVLAPGVGLIVEMEVDVDLVSLSCGGSFQVTEHSELIKTPRTLFNFFSIKISTSTPSSTSHHQLPFILSIKQPHSTTSVFAYHGCDHQKVQLHTRTGEWIQSRFVVYCCCPLSSNFLTHSDIKPCNIGYYVTCKDPFRMAARNMVPVLWPYK